MQKGREIKKIMDNKRRKSVTMQDIAQAADVSVATVSHVINNTAKFSPETVELVQKTIKELGYKPRPHTELYQGNRTIAVFVPDLSNEFYSCITQAISKEAAKRNYAVIICNIHHYKTEIGNLRALLKIGVQGLIFCGGGPDDETQIINAAKIVPVVLCDRKIIGSQIDSIGTNNLDVMKQVIRKLARFGYHKIGYISEDLVMSNAYDRYIGFRLGMEDNGLEIDPRWVILDPNLRLSKNENAYHVMRSILSKTREVPQILLCSSDLIAIGVIAALKEKGYNIPKEIGVIGFDDISLAKFSAPPLTTIAQDMKQLGKISVHTLIQRIEHPEKVKVSEEIALGARIVLRESARL